MSQKLQVNDFEGIKDTSQFNKDFIKIYNEESDEGYFLDVNDLPSLLERMKIEKVKKLVANLDDKTECVIHIRNLKQSLSNQFHVLFVNIKTLMKLKSS